jgi:hypothetical protein
MSIRIFKSKNAEKYYYCNMLQKAITTLDFSDKKLCLSILEGNAATNAILAIENDIKYNFDDSHSIPCSHHEFADAYVKAQQYIGYSLKTINL